MTLCDAGTVKDDPRSGLSREALAAGVALGVAGDLLLWDIDPPGLGFALWVGLLGAAVMTVNRHAMHAWRKQLLLWSVLAVVAASVLVLRATVVFLPLVALMLVTCAAMVFMQSEGVGMWSAAVRDQISALLRLPLRVLLGGWPLLGQLHLHRAEAAPRWQPVLRGALLALPLVLIFVALFSAADATFERYASGVGDLLARDLPRHFLVVLVLGWFSTGLLCCSIPQENSTKGRRPVTRLLGVDEAAIVLGSMVVLFLLFASVQLGYLFGGRELIEQTSGLTLAQYARRGFSELMVVALLTMVVLHGVCSGHSGRLRTLGVVLVVLVMCILVSAAQRLMLYVDAFGLTLSRLLATACMLWVAGCLLIFAVAMIRDRGAGLASCYVLSGVAVILLLVVANPAALVASVNLERAIADPDPARGGAPLDVTYLLQLGPDVVPAILDRFAELPQTHQCGLASGLRGRYRLMEGDEDWRAWNASRSAARRAVDNDDRLRQVRCPAPAPRAF